jgi:hypothetical protein
MKSRKSDEKKVEKLFDLFDDGWEAWPDPEAHEHEEEDEAMEGHKADTQTSKDGAHSHAGHSHGPTRIVTKGLKVKVVEQEVDDSPSPPKRAKMVEA